MEVLYPTGPKVAYFRRLNASNRHLFKTSLIATVTHVSASQQTGTAAAGVRVLRRA